MDTKICTKCSIEKPLTDFFKRKDSEAQYRSACRTCTSIQRVGYRKRNAEKIKESGKKYYKENSAKINEQHKFYREQNVEKEKKRHKIYNEENAEKIKKYSRQWRKENPEKVKERERRYYQENKINKLMSRAICNTLKKRKLSKKNIPWTNLVDYTPEELKKHLENQFEPWMNWDNHGSCEADKQKWHIDHIKPQSLFEIKEAGDEEFKKCWALENLRPLEAIENIKKSNKY